MILRRTNLTMVSLDIRCPQARKGQSFLAFLVFGCLSRDPGLTACPDGIKVVFWNFLVSPAYSTKQTEKGCRMANGNGKKRSQNGLFILLGAVALIILITLGLGCGTRIPQKPFPHAAGLDLTSTFLGGFFPPHGAFPILPVRNYALARSPRSTFAAWRDHLVLLAGGRNQSRVISMIRATAPRNK